MNLVQVRHTLLVLMSKTFDKENLIRDGSRFRIWAVFRKLWIWFLQSQFSSWGSSHNNSNTIRHPGWRYLDPCSFSLFLSCLFGFYFPSFCCSYHILFTRHFQCFLSPPQLITYLLWMSCHYYQDFSLICLVWHFRTFHLSWHCNNIRKRRNEEFSRSGDARDHI